MCTRQVPQTAWVAAAVASCVIVLSSCADGEARPPATRLDPPAAEGAMAPRLSRLDGGALLTWLEPDGRGHRLRAARLEVERNAWSEPRAISAGHAFFANWADVPGASQVGGTLWAHWLEKLGDDTYAYGVRIARSRDRGDSWEHLGLLHDDASPTEHGFVSYVASSGGLRAFWLDGRAMAQGGSMQLRTARLDGGGAEPSELLDDRVCECCATDSALTSRGGIVVYRDRSNAEVRDVAFVIVDGTGPSEPALVHADGWNIGGCPVNGPAVDAAGERVVVAWFTAADERPRVLAAFSSDGGASFAAPIVVDDQQPLGRVDTSIDAAGDAVVTWISTRAGKPELRLQRVAGGGLRGEPRVLAATTARRSSGVPTLLRVGDRLIVAWVEDADPARLRAAAFAIRDL